VNDRGGLIRWSAESGEPARPGSRSRIFHGSHMRTDEECVEYARECVRLAGLSEDQEIRDQLLNMAREWMGAAMDETRRVRRKPYVSSRSPPAFRVVR